MARPKLEDGYFTLSYELLAGVLGTPAVEGLRGSVLLIVLGQVYGWAKRPHATLSPRWLSLTLGEHESNICRAIRELVAFGVLAKVSRGQYAFVKDYESYRFKESAEEASSRIAFARSFPSLVKAFRTSPDALPVINSDNPGLSNLITEVIKSDNLPPREVIRIDNANSSEMITRVIKSDNKSRSPLDPPICEGEFEKEKGVVVPHADAGARTREGNPPEIGDPKARRDRLVALAEDARPAEGANGKIDGWILAYGIDWTEMAVVTGMASDIGRLWQYVNGCLIRWKSRGGPVPAEVVEADRQRAALRADAPASSAVPAPHVRPTASEARRAAWLAEAAKLKVQSAAEDR